jgi:SAM-dependent methyltransferase
MSKNIDLIWDKEVYNDDYSFVVNLKQKNSKSYFINDCLKKTNKKKIRVLEIGCGYGQNLFPISENVYECIGIDPSKKSIQLGRDTIELKKCQIRVGCW